MKTVSVSDDFAKEIICLLILELAKIPAVQGSPILVLLIKILKAMFSC